MFISRFIQANYFKKYLAENAVNTISEPLDFKIFLGEMPPDPLPTRPSRARFQPPPPLRNTLPRPCFCANSYWPDLIATLVWKLHAIPYSHRTRFSIARANLEGRDIHRLTTKRTHGQTMARQVKLNLIG